MPNLVEFDRARALLDTRNTFLTSTPDFSNLPLSHKPLRETLPVPWDGVVDCRNSLEDANSIRDAARRLAERAALEGAPMFEASFSAADGPVDVVDLFSGCGGLSTGFEIVGRMVPSYRLAGAVDLDPWAAKTFARNLSVEPLLSDLSRVLESNEALDELVGALSLRPGSPLVLIGGPPCQGFSAHRKKAGKPDDVRNRLIQAFAKVADRLQPDIVVMENVPELLARKHWGQYKEFRGSLKDAGYVVQSQIHNLAGFGVPQERFRALVVAARRPLRMPTSFLAPGEFLTVRDAIGSLAPVAPGERDEFDPMHFCTRHRKSTVDTIKQVPVDGGRRPHGVGPACLDRVDGFRDVYGRMFWDRPANTITSYARNPASGRYVHPEQHRGLTIREAALLQGFPRQFHFEGPFDHLFVQIGNAVPPPFAAYVAAHLLGELLVPDESAELFQERVEVLGPTSDSFSSGIAGRKRGNRNLL